MPGMCGGMMNPMMNPMMGGMGKGSCPACPSGCGCGCCGGCPGCGCCPTSCPGCGGCPGGCGGCPACGGCAAGSCGGGGCPTSPVPTAEDAEFCSRCTADPRDRRSSAALVTPGNQRGNWVWPCEKRGRCDGATQINGGLFSLKPATCRSMQFLIQSCVAVGLSRRSQPY